MLYYIICCKDKNLCHHLIEWDRYAVTLFRIKISHTALWAVGPGWEKISKMHQISFIILISLSLGASSSHPTMFTLISNSVNSAQGELKAFPGRKVETETETEERQTAGWPSRIFIVADFEIFNICDLPFHSAHLLPYDLQFLHRKILSFIWWIFSCFVGPAARQHWQINICRY